MSVLPDFKSEWLDVGNGVLLRAEREYITAADLLANLREYDMIEINLLYPEKHLVAVDIGVKPRIIHQDGQDNVVLLGQVSTLQRFSKMIQFQCDCLDRVNQDYYTLSLGVSRKAPHEASMRICASPQPIEDFGAPPPDMEAAFAAFLLRCIQGKPLRNSHWAWRGYFIIYFLDLDVNWHTSF